LSARRAGGSTGRMGEMSSNGHRIYGYHYAKKTPTVPATLVINEDQAAIVRSIFEMFASGDFGLVTATSKSAAS
jgi:hypothetical protein